MQMQVGMEYVRYDPDSGLVRYRNASCDVVHVKGENMTYIRLKYLQIQEIIGRLRESVSWGFGSLRVIREYFLDLLPGFFPLLDGRRGLIGIVPLV